MLPPSLPEQLPWLDYWRGASLIQVEPDAARAPLTRAFVRFEKEQDTLGRILACTGMILTYYVEFANMTPIDPWIDALLALLDAEPDFPSPAVELRVNAVLVFALTFRRPDPEPLQKRVAKTTTLLAADISANDKVVAAIFLLAYLYRVGTVEQAARHIRQLQPVVDLDKVSPVNKALWLRSVGYFSWYAGDTARAEKALRSALETAASNAVALSSIHGLSFWALAACALDHGDFSLAESYCDKAAAFCQPRPLDRFFEARLKAMLASHRRDWGRAVRYAEWALAAASESGVVHLQFLGKVALANALIDSARHADAMQVVSQARILIARTAFAPYECQTNLVQAYAALRQGDTARCHERLRAAFSGANPEEYAAYHCVRYHPELLSSLFAEALAAEIDTDYVRYLIHRLDVLPPGPEAVHWPWPLRIRTLGHFELLHDGRPLEFSRKVPKKPLQLLKATIAFGSTEVPEQRLIDALWPDEVGDRAYSAFTMALNRLRKLLGVADAIQHRGGRLTIDRRRCWLDVAAFERLMEPSVNADVAEPHNGTRRALDLYRGSFLEDEGEAPWAARARERFRRMFVQGLSVSAQWLEQTHQYDAAIALYRRGVEADDLEEQFYRGLMRCHGKTGRRAEAMNVYRRLRQTLSITLGIAPGPTTEELANQVQQGLNSV
jgi:LuxR family maltose regulon positive regulatory protein